MSWFNDEWDWAYDEVVYIPEETEEEDKEAAYFDVPLPYRYKSTN